MEKRNVEMFISTCTYLNNLIDHIMESNAQIDPETLVPVNDLTTKLLNFMNNLYRSEFMIKNNSSTSINGRSRGHGCSLPESGSNHSLQLLPTSAFQIRDPVSIPVTNYGAPSGLVSFKQNPSVNKSQTQAPTPISNHTNTSKSKKNIDEKKSTTEIPIYNSTPISNPISKASDNTSKSSSNVNCNTPYANVVKNNCNPKSMVNTAPSVVNVKKHKKNKKTVTPVQPLAANHTAVSPHTASNVQISSSDNKIGTSSLRPVTNFDKKYITRTLEAFVMKIASTGVISTASIYCRCCDTVIANSWTKHTNKEFHVMNASMSMDLRMFSCSKCGISFFGSEKKVLRCFEFHFMIVHLEDSHSSWRKTIIESDRRNIVPSSSALSVTKSNLNGKKIKKSLTPSQNLSQVKVKSIEENNSKQNMIPVNESISHSVINISQVPTSKSKSSSENMVSSSYPEFHSLIGAMSDKWLEHALVIDAGFCDLCQLGIVSGFKWLSHVTDHGLSKVENCKESICPECNLKLFGNNVDKYFALPAHLSFHKLISK